MILLCILNSNNDLFVDFYLLCDLENFHVILKKNNKILNFKIDLT